MSSAYIFSTDNQLGVSSLQTNIVVPVQLTSSIDEVWKSICDDELFPWNSDQPLKSFGVGWENKECPPDVLKDTVDELCRTNQWTQCDDSIDLVPSRMWSSSLDWVLESIEADDLLNGETNELVCFLQTEPELVTNFDRTWKEYEQERNRGLLTIGIYSQ